MRKLPRAALPLFALLAFALVAPPAAASVVLKSNVEEMTRLSALVVHGEVLSVAPYKRPGSRMQIVTDVTLRVIEVMKGDHEGPNLTFTLPGGRVGDYTMKIPGMPQFRAGEAVVLFLEPTREGYAISGLQQGRFSIMTEPVTGMKVALRAYTHGLALAHRDPAGQLVIEPGEGTADRRSLDDLRTAVKRTVRVYGARPEVPRDGMLPARPDVPSVSTP